MKFRIKPATAYAHFSERVQSRSLTFQEVDDLLDWLKAHKHLMASDKMIQNHRRMAAQLKEEHPFAQGIRLTVRKDLNPELALLFKLRWG